MIWSLFVKKLVRSAIQAGLAYLGADRLVSWGVTVDETVLVGATYGALEGLRQVLKRKLGWKWL